MIPNVWRLAEVFSQAQPLTHCGNKQTKVYWLQKYWPHLGVYKVSQFMETGYEDDRKAGAVKSCHPRNRQPVGCPRGQLEIHHEQPKEARSRKAQRDSQQRHLRPQVWGRDGATLQHQRANCVTYRRSAPHRSRLAYDFEQIVW